MADIPACNKRTKLTPADNTDIGECKGILIMDAGDVAIRFDSGDSAVTITFEAMSYIPFKVYSIDSTNTTSSHIFKLF